MADETEVIFLDDPKVNNESEKLGNFSKNYTSSTPINSGYTIIEKNIGESKNRDGQILIETSIKGLLYRTEVFKDSILIDAREIDCKDLASQQNKDVIFKQKYLATHNTFIAQYIAQEFFKEVLKDEGDFKNGDEHCKIITSISEDTIRSIIYLDGEEFDTKETIISDNIKSKKHLIESKYTTFHSEIKDKYLDKDKFPINTFLNPILKKLFFYEKNPMYSFYLFLFLIILGLFAVKIAVCSDFMINRNKGKKKFEYLVSIAPFCTSAKNKIIKNCDKSYEGNWKIKSKVYNKKACKGSCIDYDFIDGEICDKWIKSLDLINSTVKINPYTITPSSVLELSDKKITTIYTKNNTGKTLRMKVTGVSIDNNPNNEIVFFINEKIEVSLDPQEEDQFEIKLEGTYFGGFEKGEYTGNIIFLITNDDESIKKTEKKNFKFTID